MGLADNLKEFLESPEGKEFSRKYVEKMKMKNVVEIGRRKKFEKWLENNDFDKTFYRILLEHGEDYKEKCSHNGYMPYANNKLSFIIDYAFDNCEAITVKELEWEHFPSNTVLFMGYYFQIIYGQGSVTYIYNKDDMRLLLQL